MSRFIDDEAGCSDGSADESDEEPTPPSTPARHRRPEANAHQNNVLGLSQLGRRDEPAEDAKQPPKKKQKQLRIFERNLNP